MSRRPATLTQADIARVIRAAKQAGAAEVEVRVGEQPRIIIRIVPSTGDPGDLEGSREIVL
jgi:2-iminoacetate synthase ThiH